MSRAFTRKRIHLIPLDSRPVCYDMPRRLAEIAGLELNMPGPALLGQLKKPADFKRLERWVKNHLFENDPLIVALDTVAFGGLIAGRVNEDSLDTLRKRVDAFFAAVRAEAIFGFSAVLRIPAYNNAEEEPAYWKQWGKALYQYSVDMHRQGSSPQEARIPAAVLSDFNTRRQKNHALNKSYFADVEAGRLDYLTFCQDDTGPFGLNVKEACDLGEQIAARNLQDRAHVQTGADEVAACMMARWMSQQQAKAPRIFPVYTDAQGKDLIARFDGLPISDVVEKAIAACGAVVAKKASDADLWVLVHPPSERQGDHCSRLSARTNPAQLIEAEKILAKAKQQNKPVTLADVAYANGSDPRLAERLLSHDFDLNGLYGYAGWNTPGNAIGTAVAMGLVRLLAEKAGSFNAEAFARLLLIRLGDDWLYQSDVRQRLRAMQNGTGGPPDEALLNVAMADGLQLLKGRLGLQAEKLHCRFPCDRTFEVEIAF